MKPAGIGDSMIMTSENEQRLPFELHDVPATLLYDQTFDALTRVATWQIEHGFTLISDVLFKTK